MWVCRLPVHIAPAECTGFTEIFGEFVTSHWADRVVGPYGEASMHTYPVGADDSVRPQDISFYENPRRIRNLSLGRCGHRPLQGAAQICNCPSGGAEPRPYQDFGKFALPHETIRQEISHEQ